jgi:hypothetical protein
MTHSRWLAGLTLALALGARGVEAQVGGGYGGCTVPRPFHCVMVHSSEGQGAEQRTWVNAIILWRVPRWRLQPDSARTDSIERAYRRREYALRDSGWAPVGGRSLDIVHEGEIDARRTTIRVRDRLFPLPQRDSALVLMLDQTRDSSFTPNVVGTAYVPAVMPDGYWTKSWTSGDTTFTVRPRRSAEVLTDLLRANPAVRRFLEARPPDRRG